MKCWLSEIEGFAFFKSATRLNSKAPVYEPEIQTQIWNENLYMEIGISNRQIWNVDPTKCRFLLLFQIITRLNSQNQYMKLRFRPKSET